MIDSYVPKADQAAALFLAGKRKEALKMAKTFRFAISAEDSKQLVRGFECYDNGRFYEQLGYNAREEIEKACNIFKKCFVREN